MRIVEKPLTCPPGRVYNWQRKLEKVYKGGWEIISRKVADVGEDVAGYVWMLKNNSTWTRN